MSTIPIHVAVLSPKRYLFLKKNEEVFCWFHVNDHFEWKEKTPVHGPTIAQAIAEGYKVWERDSFRLVQCGFRYTLPERDEVGSNALFQQMVLSYTSFNGRYFDEEVGHICLVDFASQEALEIWRKIRISKPSGNTPV
jgi:hypothetical protein